MVHSVLNWQVLTAMESLRDHFYTTYEFNKQTNKQAHGSGLNKWKITKEEHDRFAKKLIELSQSPNIAATPENLSNILDQVYDKTFPKLGNVRNLKKPAYWWSEENKDIREACISTRRNLTRARKRHKRHLEEAFSNYKNARKQVKLAIQNTTAVTWSSTGRSKEFISTIRRKHLAKDICEDRGTGCYSSRYSGIGGRNHTQFYACSNEWSITRT